MDVDPELLAVFREEVAERTTALLEGVGRPPSKWNLRSLFQLAHNIKGAARMVEAEAMQRAAHALEDLLAELRDGAPRDEAATELVRHGAGLVARIADDVAADHGDAVAAYADAVAPHLGAAPAAGGANTGRDEADPREESVPEPDGDSTTPARDATATVRVAADKLRNLSELASDLLAAQFQLAEAVGHVGDLRGAEAGGIQVELRRAHGEVAVAAEASARINDQLQAAVRNLQMVSLETTRSLYTRVVTEAQLVAGKEVEFHMAGAETEIERELLAHVNEALIHILRNAVAHGIEPPEQRRQVGKPAAGRVRLTATSTAGRVRIEVEDDGAGIDLDALRAHRGRPGASDEEALAWIFDAGTSTTAETTELSGRGVGLDVVRNRLEAIGGTVDVDTIPGAGTRFVLSVPLSRLTVNGLLVRSGAADLVLPLDVVERSLAVAPGDIGKAEGRSVLVHRDEALHALDLSAILGTGGTSGEARAAVIVRADGRGLALLVDEIQGQREVVLQGLPPGSRGLTEVTGVTVLDGHRLALLLDPFVLAGGETGTATPAASRSGDGEARILVVDDSITSRTLERNILASAGYAVDTATDGEEGLQALQAADYDLVVTDVEMPAMDGFELTRRIRNDPRFARLPVILVTSLGNEAQRNEGAKAGADEYIVKGEFDQDQLLAAVRRLIA